MTCVPLERVTGFAFAGGGNALPAGAVNVCAPVAEAAPDSTRGFALAGPGKPLPCPTVVADEFGTTVGSEAVLESELAPEQPFAEEGDEPGHPFSDPRDNGSEAEPVD